MDKRDVFIRLTAIQVAGWRLGRRKSARRRNKNKRLLPIVMKLIKSLTVFACAFALVATIALAEDKEAKKQTCCEKATAKGKECAHPCCVEAHKAGKSCEKCNPNGEDKKK